MSEGKQVAVQGLSAVEALVMLTLAVTWMLGVVLAFALKGFWAGVAACAFVPYAWYVLAERILQTFSII